MKGFLTTVIVILFFAVSACAQKPMSDREADDLKGKVKKVVTESARLTNQSGNWAEGKRQTDSIVTYDVEGNRMRHELYGSKGNLTKVEEYISVDGDRAMKEEVISPDNFNGGGSSSPNPDKAKAADRRYTYKFKYKYDDKGTRTEESWYSNDGSLQSRYVSVYDEKGQKVEYSRYTADGKLFARRVRKFDDEKNVIEETLSWPSSPRTEKMSFSYEFDLQGNWIKRKSMRWVTKDGKSYFEPFYVSYREFTYF